MHTDAADCAIKFRRYSHGDEHQILELLKPTWKYYQRPEGLEYWHWLYKGNPIGDAMILLATHEERVIGHYALFPLRMRYGRKSIKGGKVEGSAVGEGYRGNIASKYCPHAKEFRVFGRLINQMFTGAPEEDASLIWGFPNDAAVKPQIRGGYDHHSIALQVYNLPIDIRRTIELEYSSILRNKIGRMLLFPIARMYCRLRSRRHQPPSDDVSEATYHEISPSDMSSKLRTYLEEYAGQREHITIERDQDYLRWRFLDNPVIKHTVFVAEREQAITAMIAIAISENGSEEIAKIVDMTCLDGKERDLSGLLWMATQSLKERVAYVKTWMSDCEEGKRFVPILKKQGFIYLPRGWRRPRLDLIYRVFDNSLTKEFAADPHNWYITMAFTEGTS